MEFAYGEIRPTLPEGYTPPEMWPEYGYITNPPPICRREMVQENPVAVRWSLWPLCFEQHVGDKEPDFSHPHGDLAYTRFVGWRRLHEGPIPKGWHKGFPALFRIDGYQTLHDGQDWIKRWHKNAQRDIRLWKEEHEGITHVIEPVTLEEYEAAYHTSLTAKHAGLYRIELLKEKLALPQVKGNIELYGVRNVKDKVLIAGTAVIFSPQYKSSTHFAPFIHTRARSVFAATALMHHWFSTSLQHGCPIVMTTDFWFSRRPKGWKGFSEFKSHFGFEFYTYPPLLWRIVPGKLW